MVPELFVQTTWLMLNTCFPLGSLEFWQVLGRWCLRGWTLIKTRDFQAHASVPGRQHLTGVVTAP